MKFKDIYLVTEKIHNGRGYLKERILKPVNAVVTIYLEEEVTHGQAVAFLFHARWEVYAIS